MRTRFLRIALAAPLLLAACRGNDSASGPQTVTQLAADVIATSTADDATPLDLNTLPISDADTDEISLPQPVQ